LVIIAAIVLSIEWLVWIMREGIPRRRRTREPGAAA
jgi:hypothetical protein